MLETGGMKLWLRAVSAKPMLRGGQPATNREWPRPRRSAPRPPGVRCRWRQASATLDSRGVANSLRRQSLAEWASALPPGLPGQGGCASTLGLMRIFTEDQLVGETGVSREQIALGASNRFASRRLPDRSGASAATEAGSAPNSSRRSHEGGDHVTTFATWEGPSSDTASRSPPVLRKPVGFFFRIPGSRDQS